MPQIDDVVKKYSALDLAITNALENEVAEVVRAAVSEAAIQEVYETYFPDFLSRRDPQYGGGDTSASRRGHGITDPNSVEITVNGNELIAKDNPDWQQLYGSRTWRPATRLAEAIATGDARYHMEKAGPRPFHDTAKHIAIESGAVERALREGLKRQGIDSSGLTFKIT